MDASVKAGLGIGVGIDIAMLHYTKAQYEEKLNELEQMDARLDSHLDKLTTLKSQIPSFWEDENGSEAVSSLNEAITNVTNASNQTKHLIQACKNIVEELDSKEGEVSTLLEDSKNILSNLNDIG